MDEGVRGALAEARALGFLGPGPLDAHEASADAFAAALGTVEGRALDLGSGGGVPGLLLAAHYPDVDWVLLDVHRRRTSFLARAVAALGWAGRVQVVRAAAEEAAHEAQHRASYDVVTSRSFAPPAITAECAAGFLKLGARLAVAEPPDDRPERWPAAGLAELGLQALPSGGSIALCVQVAAPSVETPRPWRTMERRPLW